MGERQKIRLWLLLRQTTGKSLGGSPNTFGGLLELEEVRQYEKNSFFSKMAVAFTFAVGYSGMPECDRDGRAGGNGYSGDRRHGRFSHCDSANGSHGC